MPSPVRRSGLRASNHFSRTASASTLACRHRLFFAQTEYRDNLIFRKRTALDRLGERLLDANRTIGRPHKITIIFGRKISRRYKGKLQTVIEDMELPNPVLHSYYGHAFSNSMSLIIFCCGPNRP
jgi:hypothetical protein